MKINCKLLNAHQALMQSCSFTPPRRLFFGVRLLQTCFLIILNYLVLTVAEILLPNFSPPLPTYLSGRKPLGPSAD